MRTSILSRGVQVTPWPPRIEPEGIIGYDLLARIIAAQEDSPLWDLHRQLPHGIAESGCGWKGAYIWAANQRRADGLLATNPSLLRLLACELQPPLALLKHVARNALSGSNADVLFAVGYPASRSLARVIGRLPGAMQQRETFRRIRECWKDPARRKLMCHVRRWTHDALEVLEMPTTQVTYRLLQAAGETPLGHNDVSMGLKLLAGEWSSWLHHQEGHIYSTLPRWPFRQIEAPSLHTAAYRLASRRFAAERFRDPPLPSRDYIEPIIDMRQLIGEGQSMKNCVTNYHAGMLDGEYYAYIMRRPKCRCTMLIQLKGDTWVLAELRGFNNSLPSLQAILEAVGWLAECQTHADPERLDCRMEAAYDCPWDEDQPPWEETP